MEFTKVAKEYSRMCNAYPYSCNDGNDVCPMDKVRGKEYVCRYWTLVVDPEKAEEVIMDWAKEHPVVTNRDKFKEVFGIDPVLVDWWSIKGAAWLSNEYKEPDKNG